MLKRIAALFGFALFAASAHALPVNGDFSQPLNPATDWSSLGNVSLTSGHAQLSDGPGDGGRLWQAMNLGSGSFSLGFDFSNALSLAFPQGTFPDVFFASLYFVNDLAQFDLDALIFDDSLALMSLEQSTPSSTAGTFSASTFGPDWQRFSIDFTSQYAYTILVFELFDGNFLASDSAVLLDDVGIADPVIPEPLSLTLVAGGLLLARLRRRPAAV